jgi:hypothetical protein
MTPFRRIQRLIDIDRKEARKLYREEYGIGVDDDSVDQELEQAVRGHDWEGGGVIPFPAKIALALALRPRGPKGRSGNRPPLERWVQRIRALAVREVNERFRKKVSANPARGMRKRHREEAVNETLAQGRNSAARITAKWLEREIVDPD